MGLEAAVTRLAQTLKTLAESVEAIQFCAVEDRPRRGDSVLVDLIDAASEDVKALIRDARKAAKASRKAMGPPLDLDRVRIGLTRCQSAWKEASDRFSDEIATYDRITSLKRLGRERGGEWYSWASELGRKLTECQSPFLESQQALFECWQELAERASAGGISVHTTGIGMVRVQTGDGPESVGSRETN